MGSNFSLVERKVKDESTLAHLWRDVDGAAELNKQKNRTQPSRVMLIHPEE